MCLIIHSPAGHALERSIIESALKCNADGVGIMHSGQARKWRQLSAQEILHELEPLTDIEYAIHFRMATDGKVTKSLAHPFKLSNRAYLMHNGILSQYRTSTKAQESDTSRFVAEFCNPQIKQHGSIPRAALEQAIVGSKVCVMFPDGNISRYGSGWVEYAGAYFSNTYAWDYPLDPFYKMGSYRNSSICDMDDEGELLSIEINRDYSALSERIVDSLHPIADELPLNTADYIYYDDLALWDMLLAGEIFPCDFVECCSDSTLLELYSFAIRDGLIAA